MYDYSIATVTGGSSINGNAAADVSPLRLCRYFSSLLILLKMSCVSARSLQEVPMRVIIPR